MARIRMDRRTVLSVLGLGALSACGGGGGGGGPDASALASATAAPAAASFAAPPDIAAWGDSHTSGLPGNAAVPGYAVKLQEIAQGRQVFNGGIAGQTSTGIADRQVQDDAHDTW